MPESISHCSSSARLGMSNVITVAACMCMYRALQCKLLVLLYDWPAVCG